MILVTGINGFVGKHLARELSSRGAEVIGIGHRESQVSPEISDCVKSYYRCDVADSEQVCNLPLQDVNAVINLAGLANVGASFDNAELYMKVNVSVLSVLGEELFKASPNARMIAVSTGALYDPSRPMPLNEQTKTIEKGSPYALSKLAMEQSAKDFHDQGFDCVVVRPFNHIGPGQGPGFLIPDLVEKLKRADSEHPQISAGNINTIRDYTDVRDIAKAYSDLALAETVEHTLYNVCSGAGRSGEDIIKVLCEQLGVNFDKLKIEVDESLIRPTDPAKIVGDHSLLTNDVGWQPTIGLEQTVKDIVSELN